MVKYFGLTARLLLLFCHTGGACALYSLPLDTGPARVVFSFEKYAPTAYLRHIDWAWTEQGTLDVDAGVRSLFTKSYIYW